MSEEKVKGVVKWYSSEKNYGFIIADGTDYFVHHSEIKNGEELIEGDEVEFEITQSEKGFRASSVTKIGD